MSYEWNDTDQRDVEVVDARDGDGDRVKFIACDGFVEVRAYQNGWDEPCVVWLGAKEMAELADMLSKYR